MGKNRGLTSAAVNHPALRRRSEEPHTHIHIIHMTDLFTHISGCADKGK